MGWWIVKLIVYLIYVISGVVHGSAPTSNIGFLEKPQRCTYHRAYSMHGAYCSNLNMHSVPKTLKTNLQILDVSFNRIRILRNSTFTQYPSLRYLYMGDNMIQTIETGTFDPLPYLETLDLSINALTTIPEFILNLPSLRKLYLAENSLVNLNNDLKAMAKPFQAPLSFLNLAKCELKTLPDFGIMPELEVLNVSSNELRNLSPNNFAPFCGLAILDLTNAMYVQEYCNYKTLTEWFKERNVKVQPDIDTMFSQDSEDGKCAEIQFSDEDVNLFLECKSTIKTRVFERNAKKTWMIIAGSIAGCIVAFMAIFCYIHKRNVKKTTTNRNKTVNTQNENLLNYNKS